MKLNVKHLSMAYWGHAERLHGLSFELDGRFCAIYGTEESGKTTLLKCLAGIEAHCGEVTLDDTPLITTGTTCEVGMVFDDLALFEWRSAYYNLTYPLRVRRIPKEQWANIVDPVIKAWELDGIFWETSARRLSTDIRVRLSLARAFLLPKRLLLLDDPLRLCAVDDRAHTWDLLRRNSADYPGMIVWATRDIDAIIRASLPVLVLEDGYLLANGDIRDIADNPPSVTVAERLNRYYTTYETTLCVDDGISYPIAYDGKALLVGVPMSAWHVESASETEHAIDKDYAIADEPNIIETIRLPMGKRYATAGICILQDLCDGRPCSHVRTKDGTVVVPATLAIGSAVRIWFDGNDAQLFDAHNGYRIG